MQRKRIGSMMIVLALAGFLAGILPAQNPQPGALPAGAIQVPVEKLAWGEAPPSLPAGTQMMLLEGDPRKEGLFTLRLKIPAGTRLQPHWHPRDERVTVLSGLVKVGFGDEFEEANMVSFGPGSFYLNPAQSRHYVWFVEETVMQLTNVGPWEVLYPGQPE